MNNNFDFQGFENVGGDNMGSFFPFTMFSVIFAIVFIGIAASIIFNIVRGIKRASSKVSGFMDVMQSADMEYRSTPKSLSGGDRLFEPSIMNDFPEFHKATIFAEAEKCLRLCLEAIEHENLSQLEGVKCTDGVKAYVKSRITDGIHEQFNNVVIHKTCISNYIRTKEYSTVKIQIAFEYNYVYNGVNKGKQQLRAELDYSYLFAEYQRTSAQNVISTICPNCGAPVDTSTGKCKYCGAGVHGVLEKIWAFTNIKINN